MFTIIINATVSPLKISRETNLPLLFAIDDLNKNYVKIVNKSITQCQRHMLKCTPFGIYDVFPLKESYIFVEVRAIWKNLVKKESFLNWLNIL